MLGGDFIIVGVIIIVFRPRDFINVGAVLNVKSTLGLRVEGLGFRVSGLGFRL